MPNKGGVEEEFEYLVNLLASDGVECESSGPMMPQGTPGIATQPHKGNGGGDGGPNIQRGIDGKLDLGRVKAFYESKNSRTGKKKGKGESEMKSAGPWTTDHDSQAGTRNLEVGLLHDTVTDYGHQTVSRQNEQRTAVATPPHHEDFREDDQARGPPPSGVDRERWVDEISEQDAKRLLLEISDAMRLKLVPDSDDSPSSSSIDRALNQVGNVADFLVRMDELVWRRSEHGAEHGVFDVENISAVEERVRLWEGIARGPRTE